MYIEVEKNWGFPFLKAGAHVLYAYANYIYEGVNYCWKGCRKFVAINCKVKFVSVINRYTRQRIEYLKSW